MNYYSTNGQSPKASLKDAVVRGLAPDRGLYMPERIPTIPSAFFRHIGDMSLQDIAYVAANTLFGEDIESSILQTIVNDTLSFEIPLVEVDSDKYALELFHGPTLAFKDVGARFMARLLGYFNRQQSNEDVNVLVATSGDTGSAVANGFLNVPGVRVFVLYPKGKVSRIQEAQFTTLGCNVTAIEVDGTFDDCQALVKSAFMDKELNDAMKLTSANSINVARFLPQMFYYFHAYARLVGSGKSADKVVFAVPSGNFGNICAGLIAKYNPRPSIATIANAMDVGDPSNFARILDLYGKSHDAIVGDISGCAYTDEQIADTMRNVYAEKGYILDPHGAVAYRALDEYLQPGETGIFLETAHPAKFKETVDSKIDGSVKIPARLEAFMRGEKSTVRLNKQFPAFKKYLLSL